MEGSFRPLSRGSFFNTPNKAEMTKALKVFAPFSGTFFNDGDFALMAWVHEFSSPFLGTFFQFSEISKVTAEKPVKVFSSPFLGTFFQLTAVVVFPAFVGSFRPLSWGLSFNGTW